MESHGGQWEARPQHSRAGYAIFHDSSWNQGAQGLWENPPYFAESDNFSGAGCPFGNATSVAPLNCGIQRLFLPIITSPPPPDTFPGTVQSQNLDFKQGMVQQFNLNVEHQFPANVVFTLGYAGSRSHAHPGGWLELERLFTGSVSGRQRSHYPATHWVAATRLPFRRSG